MAQGGKRLLCKQDDLSLNHKQLYKGQVRCHVKCTAVTPELEMVVDTDGSLVLAGQQA